MHYPPGPKQNYYKVIGYIPHAVLYIPMTILHLPICSFYYLHLFYPASQPSPNLPTISLFSVSESASVLSVHLFCTRCKRGHVVIYLCLTLVDRTPADFNSQTLWGLLFPALVISAWAAGWGWDHLLLVGVGGDHCCWDICPNFQPPHMDVGPAPFVS